ncbi:MAG: hypothetical protein JO362_01815 [Streptomycetaceae bacterium]|nr:hypothetical protein [Streptomycetaceae bacterium]
MVEGREAGELQQPAEELELTGIGQDSRPDTKPGAYMCLRTDGDFGPRVGGGGQCQLQVVPRCGGTRRP